MSDGLVAFPSEFVLSGVPLSAVVDLAGDCSGVTLAAFGLSVGFTSRALPSIVGGGLERFMIEGVVFAASEEAPPDGLSLPDDAPLIAASSFLALRSSSPFAAMQLSHPAFAILHSAVAQPAAGYVNAFSLAAARYPY